LDKAEVEIQFRNRRLVIDALAVVPPWVFGAVVWVAFSELILKRVYPGEFIALQAGLLGADIVGELPPGVAIVASLYGTLYLVDITEEITKTFVEGLVKSANTFFVSLVKITGLEFKA